MEELHKLTHEKKTTSLKEQLRIKREKRHIEEEKKIISNKSEDNIASLEKAFSNLNVGNDKPYKRTQIVYLEKAEEKGIIIDHSFPNQNEYFYSKYVEFYFYDCECIKDYGWGCAWRTTQTALKTYLNLLTNYLLKNTIKLKDEYCTILANLQSFSFSFEKIFLLYGSRIKLDEIYLKTKNLKTIPDYLKIIDYAPFETQNGWAEPFISYLIFSDQGIKGRLLLLNKHPRHAFAPREVFEDHILSYEEFKALIISHFSGENCAPIIIDDSLVSLNVLGFTYTHNKFTLLIGDPHVEQKNPGDSGIYSIILCEKGNIDIDLNFQHTNYTYMIQFEVKGWMIFLPECIN